MNAKGPSPLQRNPGESEPTPRAVSDELIARLIELRAPHLAHLPLGQRYDDAFDHVTVRIGEDYGASFPTMARTPSYHPTSMAHLRERSPEWGFHAQVPLIIAGPALGYGSHFAIFEWHAASNALRSRLSTQSAAALGAALASVHEPAPPQAPQHSHMQVPMTWQSQVVYDLISAVEHLPPSTAGHLDTDAARDAWDAALDHPASTAETWVHGALEPRLIFSQDGEFDGIMNWREFSRGDPVLDIALAATAVDLTGYDALLRGYGSTLDESSQAKVRATVVARSLAFALDPNPALASLGWARLRDWGATQE